MPAPPPRNAPPDAAPKEQPAPPEALGLAGGPDVLARAAVAQLTEGVIVADAAGRIVLVNEAAARLHGVARLDVPPERYADTYHLLTEDGRPYPSADLPLARAVLGGETVLGARWRIRRPDGTEVLAAGSARPITRPDGRRAGAVLTVRDETARDAAEAALAASEERARLALDAARLGAFTWDVARDAHTWDARTREIYGLAPDEPPSLERLDALVHPDDRAGARAAFAALAPTADGSPARLAAAYRVVRPDGATRWVEVHAAAHFDTHVASSADDAETAARPRRLVGTVRDVTERRQAEDDQRFLLDLGARLARLADPAEIGRAAARALGERLGLSRCFVCDVDLARDVYVIRGMEYDAGGSGGGGVDDCVRNPAGKCK